MSSTRSYFCRSVSIGYGWSLKSSSSVSNKSINSSNFRSRKIKSISSGLKSSLKASFYVKAPPDGESLILFATTTTDAAVG